MSDYIPDYWRILQTGTNGEIYYKIICTWKGSYLGGESWKISSMIVELKEQSDCFEVITQSGSTYTLYKNREGENAYLLNQYNYHLKQLNKHIGEGEFVFEMIGIDQFLNNWKSILKGSLE